MSAPRARPAADDRRLQAASRVYGGAGGALCVAGVGSRRELWHMLARSAAAPGTATLHRMLIEQVPLCRFEFGPPAPQQQGQGQQGQPQGQPRLPPAEPYGAVRRRMARADDDPVQPSEQVRR